VWWHTPVIPALGKLRQEDHEFKAKLGYLTGSGAVWAIKPVSKKKEEKEKVEKEKRKIKHNNPHRSVDVFNSHILLNLHASSILQKQFLN
jgi:hypothetical protein